MDESMRLSCPSCRAIEWFRDGTTMAVDINGEIHRVQVKGDHLEGANAPWHCGRCGFQPVANSDLATHLAEMKVALVY